MDTMKDSLIMPCDSKMNECDKPLVRRRNSRLLIPDSESQQQLGPIIGYTQEPLLPLAEACASLVDVVHDILAYVSVALEHTLAEPANGLTCDESASVRLYTMEWTGEHRSLYSILNRALNTADREDLRPWFKYLKLFLTALTKLPCAPSQTVWRGVRKNISHKFPHGAHVIWWAFSSCTKTLTVLENELYLGNMGERTLFSIELFNGRNIRAHSHFVVEDEILMFPGTYMDVQSQFNPAPDLNIIHLKQMIPVEMLLEPPFENACLYPKPSTKIDITFSKRPWYLKKKFLIPISLLAVVCLVATILGSVLGSRSVANTSNTAVVCPTNKCVFSTLYTVKGEDYYGFEHLDINCTQTLLNITIEITVQRTVNATFANQYNTFWEDTIKQTNQTTSSQILYTWRSVSGQKIELVGFPYYVEGHFNLQGVNQVASNDTYSVNGQFSGCGQQMFSYNGYF